jgi:hypothetical protein
VHPARQIASLPTSSLISPLPFCLAPVRKFLVEAGIILSHISSDAGFSQTGGLPISVFTMSQPAVSNCTACFVVAYDKFDPGSSPPAAVIVIKGIKRIKLLNPFLGELIGRIAMSYLRSSFPNPITADMDCAAVINLQDQQSHLPPQWASDQKRLYGALLRALIQGKGPLCEGNQPPIKHRYAHPERFHPATKTKPARPIIPRSKWNKRLWLNHVADWYASHNFTPEMIADNLRPRRVFRIRVEDLLSKVMSPDSLFWSSARIPSVNTICSLKSKVIKSTGYLKQRDAQTATEVLSAWILVQQRYRNDQTSSRQADWKAVL